MKAKIKRLKIRSGIEIKLGANDRVLSAHACGFDIIVFYLSHITPGELALFEILVVDTGEVINSNAIYIASVLLDSGFDEKHILLRKKYSG
ncbi:hypothetical protein [Photobacterium leiognathi]|uniref:hypothetical protein n=1 Tax=Photobacterium leiognathi TaxID=553611 RepID=UPI0029818514|nr:hypothetical protein [Photobacterium leiognathi]